MPQELTAEERAVQEAAEAKDAAAGFAAGFKKARGTEPDGAAKDTTKDEAPAQAAATTEQAPAAAATVVAVAAPAPDPWKDVPPVIRQKLESIEDATGKRLRNIEGHIGGVVSSLKEVKTAMDAARAASDAGRAAPTTTQIAAAAHSTEKWNRLKGDFPEWTEAVEERLAAERAAAPKPTAPVVDVDGITRRVSDRFVDAVASKHEEIVSQAEERALVRMRHPAWKSTVKTPEFSTWLKAQPDEVRKLTASESADDAVKVLDGYETHRKTALDADKKRQASEKRLQGALVPAGTAGAPATAGISDADAFARGFKRGRGQTK